MRLFIALSLPDVACDTLERLQSDLPPCRLVGPEQMHLTLAFLGDAKAALADALADDLALLRPASVRVTLGAPDLFGAAASPALGLTAEGQEPLAALHRQVAALVRAAGADLPRRRFRPHVTLARLPKRRAPAPYVAALLAALPSPPRLGPYGCTALGLYQSTLTPDGARHEPLALVPLPSPL